MRVAFCGNPAFALPTLEALLQSAHEVVAVISSPDRPQGRGRKLAPMPVKKFALEKDLPVLTPQKLRDPDFLLELTGLNLDALIVVAFRILPHEMFTLPRWGALNVHPSLLPKGRGPAPIQWTLLRGETETGVSIIRLTEEIDGGGILDQRRTPVQSHENFGDLHERLARMGAGMLVEVLDALESGISLQPVMQDESQVTTARKLKPEDYLLNFNLPATDLLNRIRAFAPFPGAIAKAGQFSLKILSAQIDSEASPIPAAQLKLFHDSISIGTADHPLSLKYVKPSGGKAMPVAEYLRGRPQLPERFD